MFGTWLVGMHRSEPTVVIAMPVIGGVIGAVNGALAVYARIGSFIGGSERVSFLAGIRTDRMKLGAFTIACVLVGFSAIFQFGQAGAV